MYLQNKYTKWYNHIIFSARNRTLTDYSEIHHIIPKSLGGPDHTDNLVRLTAREHFICHWLLTKMVVGKDKAKMLNAAFMMATNENPFQKRYKINSRTYEYLRKAWAAREITEETRRKIGEASKGRKQTPEARAKNSKANSGKNNAMYGKTHTAEARLKISESKIGKPGPNTGRKMSEEQKKKISESLKGRKIPQEVRNKISSSNTGKTRSLEARTRYSVARRKASTPDF